MLSRFSLDQGLFLLASLEKSWANVYFQVWIPPTFAKRLEQESKARGARILLFLYSFAISDFLSTSKDRDSRKDQIK
jgi:hypothetical protein